MARRTDEDLSRGLHQLALESGNSERASQETGIPARTLRDWREQHAERYLEIRAKVEEQVDRDSAERMRRVVADRLDILEETGPQALSALKTGNTQAFKDLAQADKSFATSAGILTGNDRALRDKPIQLVQHSHVDVTALQLLIQDKERELRLAEADVESTVVEDETSELPPAA